VAELIWERRATNDNDDASSSLLSKHPRQEKTQGDNDNTKTDIPVNGVFIFTTCSHPELERTWDYSSFCGIDVELSYPWFLFVYV
jgi:hypothetical protein